ncbi:MAG: SDR family oxidoreductase [Acidobacteriota bacterium]|nr:SDR family oxidoreductase [Acidobacteriota bacterium]
MERGLEVLIYDLNPNPTLLSKIAGDLDKRKLTIEVGRIEDTARVKALVKDGGITHIVHLAAVLMPFCQANPVAGGLVDVIGTLNVFEAARDSGRQVRVVYASSSAVWGPDDAYEHRKLSEDDPLKPATHYGVFKQANEGNARIFFTTNGISSVGLRPWAVYGFGRDLGLTADPSLAIQAAVNKRPFQIRLSGCMDMQYVEDVAETFTSCLLASFEGAHVFNLAGDVISMDDFIGVLDKVHPGAKQLITAKGPQVPVANQMDDSRLRAHVPDLPSTPLEAGIRKSIALFERHRNPT